MDRRERILGGLDLARGRGVEIGALTSPLVGRHEGPIRYVDHADTETLRLKYADHPNVDTGRIVAVDAVWGGSTLLEALSGAPADYVLASHLIEHVPDLLGWLEEVRAVLRPGGSLRLVVPDRRFTFDYLRNESTLADLVYARLRQARVPQLPALLGHILEVVELDLGTAWAGAVEPAALRRLHDLPHALNAARDMLEHGTYHDVHCWVFTPASFARLLARAAELGLVRFRCAAFHDTCRGELDFIVHLAPCDDAEAAARSWLDAAAACQPWPRQAPHQAEAEALRAGVAAHQAEIAALRQERDRLAAEAALARQQLEAMRASTFWRIGEPLRWTVRRMRGH